MVKVLHLLFVASFISLYKRVGSLQPTHAVQVPLGVARQFIEGVVGESEEILLS